MKQQFTVMYSLNTKPACKIRAVKAAFGG